MLARLEYESRFQSHAGSIEAAWHDYEHAPDLLFQSHAGSIEADGDGCPTRSRGYVSIPRWFD